MLYQAELHPDIVIAPSGRDADGGVILGYAPLTFYPAVRNGCGIQWAYYRGWLLILPRGWQVPLWLFCSIIGVDFVVILRLWVWPIEAKNTGSVLNFCGLPPSKE